MDNMNFQFIAKQIVPAETIANMMVSNLETNVNSWEYRIEKHFAPAAEDPDLWYAEAKVYTDDQTVITIRYEDPSREDNFLNKELRREDFQRGLDILAEKYPHHMADIIKENEDAITADVFLQCIVYGGIIYD